MYIVDFQKWEVGGVGKGGGKVGWGRWGGGGVVGKVGWGRWGGEGGVGEGGGGCMPTIHPVDLSMTNK